MLYVLLAVIASELLFGLGAAVINMEEAVRYARAHDARHEIVRSYPMRK